MDGEHKAELRNFCAAEPGCGTVIRAERLMDVSELQALGEDYGAKRVAVVWVVVRVSKMRHSWN